jgi:hypothetical protein
MPGSPDSPVGSGLTAGSLKGGEIEKRHVFSVQPGYKKLFIHLRWNRPIEQNGGKNAMVQDILKAINALKNTTVARCRDRIDEAARKARDVRGGGQNEETKKPAESCTPPCGVTSILKRRHGL